MGSNSFGRPGGARRVWAPRLNGPTGPPARPCREISRPVAVPLGSEWTPLGCLHGGQHMKNQVTHRAPQKAQQRVERRNPRRVDPAHRIAPGLSV